MSATVFTCPVCSTPADGQDQGPQRVQCSECKTCFSVEADPDIIAEYGVV